MMSPPTTPQPNGKRYWGEEKNIDSIYSIYLKKISYTYNNDISLSASYARQQQTTSDHGSFKADELQSNGPTSDLARLAIKSGSHCSSSNNNISKRTFSSNNRHIDINCQKQEESPRGRKNFFQKYRRRSCSMDKYSLDKHHKGGCSTPNAPKTNTTNTANNSTSAKSSKTMRYEAQSKKTSQLSDDLSVSHDQLDGLTTNQRFNDSTSQNGFATIGRLNHHAVHNDGEDCNISLPKSTNSDTPSYTPLQSLQWETRQIRILQAATLDHVLKFILLINSSKELNGTSASSSTNGEGGLEEERNNVAHIIHVFFCTYRIYTNPYELMLKLMDYSDICRIEQYRFLMHYWMDNYPEDFDYLVVDKAIQSSEKINRDLSQVTSTSHTTQSITSCTTHSSINSYDSSATSRTAATSDSETGPGVGGELLQDCATTATTLSFASGSQSGSENLDRRLSNLSIKTSDNERTGVPLVSELLRLCRDEYIRKKAMRLNEVRASHTAPGSDISRRSRQQSGHHLGGGSKNSAVLDFDSRYVAQQLTAIDLENFLNLRPYSLLEGTKSDKCIQSMVKNFNLLSRHVVVTILKCHTPHIVAAHWIAIAMNLRKIKNFNSLKAIIAGLTNESIYRLKQSIWNKLDRNNLTNFKSMASIVDDVNNQIVLRQTQLVVEGTAKMNIEEDSFGTIPYLGTFLTDLNMIDARYQSYVPSPKDETSKLKLINFEKCAKQFEILTQVQLLQKNVLASLHAIQRRNHFDEQTTLNRLKLEFNHNHQMLSAKPAIPQVSRLFENWFYDNSVASMTDKQW